MGERGREGISSWGIGGVLWAWSTNLVVMTRQNSGGGRTRLFLGYCKYWEVCLILLKFFGVVDGMYDDM